MNQTTKTIGSALTAFILAGGAAIVAVTGSGYALNKTSWTVAVVFGAMAAAKDWRATNSLPPVTPENVEAMISALNAKQSQDK